MLFEIAFVILAFTYPFALYKAFTEGQRYAKPEKAPRKPRARKVRKAKNSDLENRLKEIDKYNPLGV